MAPSTAISFAPAPSLMAVFEQNSGTGLLLLPAELRLTIYEESDGQTLLSLRKVCRILYAELPSNYVSSQFWFSFVLRENLKPAPDHTAHWYKILAIEWVYPYNWQPVLPAADHVHKFIINIDFWEAFYFEVDKLEMYKEIWFGDEGAQEVSVNCELISWQGLQVEPWFEKIALTPFWGFLLDLFPNLKHIRIYDSDQFEGDFDCLKELARHFVEACPIRLNLTFVMPWNPRNAELHVLAQKLGDITSPVKLPRDFYGDGLFRMLADQYLSIRDALAQRIEKQKLQSPRVNSMSEMTLRPKPKHEDDGCEPDKQMADAILLPQYPLD